MARERPNRHVTAKPEHVMPEKPPEPIPSPGIGQGWTIFLTIWVVLFVGLVGYELWHFFAKILGLR